jgi:hypothetical protein
MHLPQIRFEDNDYAEKVSRENPNHILTVWEYIHIYETDPPPVKENDEIVKTLSPRQMYASRCKWCALCKKRDCGSCTSCRNNKGVPHNDIIERQACLQKVRHDANASNVRNRQLTISESPRSYVRCAFTYQNPKRSNQPKEYYLLVGHLCSLRTSALLRDS